MNTTHHIISRATTKTYEPASLNEDAINETLRLKILENRRIQQLNTLRRSAHSKHYARD